MNRSNLSVLDAQGSAETALRYSERKDVLFIGCAGIGLELLDDDAAVKLDNLGLLAEPFK
jgi:hypothetical protein